MTNLMANIYIKDETKALLKQLVKVEKPPSTIKNEVHFLVEKRLRFLKPQEKPDDKTS